jgi:hypothetical protein
VQGSSESEATLTNSRPLAAAGPDQIASGKSSSWIERDHSSAPVALSTHFTIAPPAKQTRSGSTNAPPNAAPGIDADHFSSPVIRSSARSFPPQSVV